MPNPNKQYKIFDELQKIKSAYDTTVNILNADETSNWSSTGNQGGLLSFRQKDVIRMVTHYSNSKYLKGQKDELGRDKPFYNIVNGICDTERTAKDINTNDIEVVPLDGTDSQKADMLKHELKVWMNKENYAKTLNDSIEIHTTWGSVLAKKCLYKNEDGKNCLRVEFPAWKNIINDQINIPKSPIIELHWMTPGELLAKKNWYNQAEAIKYALKEHPTRRRIPVYELRGEFPRSFYNEIMHDKIVKELIDTKDYSYQLYYLTGDIGGKMICLYEEDDTEEVYKYLARKPKPGRGFGVGVVEEGEEAQVWSNDAVLKQYRAMEYTSKIVGQTASRRLRGRNILTEVDDGQILEHEENKPITTLPLLPAGGLNQYQSIISQWYQQFEKSSSAYDAQRGATPNSHTPFRLQALVLQQSRQVFQQMRQEIGIFHEEIINDWVLPFLIEEMSPEHILASEFSLEELREMDKNFATYEANQKAKQAILSGKIVTPEEYDAYFQFARDLQGRQKAHRFLQIPKNYFKNYRALAYVVTTGEQKNQAQVLESITNIMMIYAKNPQALQDPVLTLLFKEAIAMSGIGISVAQFMAAINEQAKMVKAAQQQMMVQGGVADNPNNMPMINQENSVTSPNTTNAPVQPAYASNT